MEKEIKMAYGEFLALTYEKDRLTQENKSLKSFLDKSGALHIVISKFNATETISILHWDETVITQHVKNELKYLAGALEIANSTIEYFKLPWYKKLLRSWKR